MSPLVPNASVRRRSEGPELGRSLGGGVPLALSHLPVILHVWHLQIDFSANNTFFFFFFTKHVLSIFSGI
jgi:hypothetical protein